MTTEPEQPEDALAHLPEDLRALIGTDLPGQTVKAVAQCDLDDRGMYAEAYLVLTENKLGHLVRSNGIWGRDWHDLAKLGEAKVVEGLGISSLRLLAGGKVAGEYHFTLRHAKAVAKLHRNLEKRLSGQEETAEEPLPEPKHFDEKKVRCEKCGRVIPAWSEFCPACTSRRKVLVRLMDFVKPYRRVAVTGAALAVVLTCVSLLRPYFIKPMMNQGLGLEKGRHPDFNVMVTYILLMGILTLVGAIGGAIRLRVMASLGSRIARDVRNKTYAHLHKLSLSFFATKPTGSLVTRVTADSDRIWDFVAFTVVEFMISMLTIVGVGVALFVLNWRLACLVVIPIPLMVVMMFFFHKRMYAIFAKLHHRWSQMVAVVSDALPGVRVIKAFGQEDRETHRFGAKNQQVYEGELSMVSLWTFFEPVMQLLSQIGSLLVWFIGGLWVLRGWMDIGTLIAYTGYMWMFYGPIHTLSHMDRMLNRAATSVQRIFEILDAQPAIFSRTGATSAKGLGGRIELRNVSFSYDGIRKVLKGVSLTIAPGEMIGLAGPSGGGKTTMVNLICRFYDVLDGQILIDGVDVRDYDLETLRRNIGVVLQEPFLFHGTVTQNIAYGNPDATLEQVIEAANAANAHDFIVGFPDGYDTLVGERGQTLSGGERQRISIARAILSNPRILILDEATSSVDTETEKLIQEALDRLVANRTTIAIAHRLSTLRKAHRLVILENGVIVEEGAHEQLAVKEGGLYAKLLRMQTEMQSVMAIGS